MLHARNDYDRIQDPDGLIPDDEPVFLVRAQDQAFVPTLLAWCKAHDDAGGQPMMTAVVLRHIASAIEWRETDGRVKVADAPPRIEKLEAQIAVVGRWIESSEYGHAVAELVAALDQTP